ncbi:hypothetical protein BH23GEM7_BH23GEM7_27910 [soil metagenome]
MRLTWSKCILAMLVLALGGALPAAAQAGAGRTGVIAGRVTSTDTGAPLVGARVEVVSLAGQPISGVITDQAGRYRLENIAPGSYTLLFNTLGFEGGRVENVRVGAAETTTVNAQLTPRAIQLNPVIVSASRRQERVLDAPAAVAVVGEEEIQVRPTVTPSDHLRSVPGVDVISQGLQSANVVARGFNNIFSGAMLTLTDHRIAAIPSLRVNALYMVPSNNEDIERIEVVLGPGAALYGPNTANGVLHIFTRSPLLAHGTTVAVTGGERNVFQGTFRTAHLVNDNLGFKFSGQYLQGDEWEATDQAELQARNNALANPELFRANLRAQGITDVEIDRRLERIGVRDFALQRWGFEARADWRVTPSLTTVFQGGRSMTMSGVELTGLGAAQIQDWSYDFFQMRATTGRLFGQVYVNTSNAGETFTLRDAEPVVDESVFLVAQLQHALSLGTRQNFTYGIDFLRTVPRTRRTIHGIHEDDDIINEVGAYIQSETSLSPQFDLVLAGRVDDHNWIEEPVFSPRAALVYKPTANQSIRATYNRAFSTPGSVNLFLDKGAGRAPGVLGALGYGLHAQGTYTSGFTFRQPDGSYLMRSPFNPAATGGPMRLIPVNAAPFYPAAVFAATATVPAPLQPAVRQLLLSIAPQVQASVGTSVFNPLNPTAPPVPLAAANIADIPGIRESNTNTYEVGYKGILARRLLLAADAWYSQKDNFISPLTVSTPLIVMDPTQLAPLLGQLAPTLVGMFMQAGLPLEQAQAQAQTLLTGVASVPVGVIASEQVASEGPALLVTYRNFGNVDLYGLDLSATALVTDQFTLTVGASFVNEDHFQTEGEVIALNAPKRKGTLALGYRNDGLGFTGEARVRYNAQFPVNSGVYVGLRCIDPSLVSDLGSECVQSYTLMDLNLGYRLPQVPGTSIQLMIQNLLDEPYQSFVGVPQIGRLALLRLKYEF